MCSAPSIQSTPLHCTSTTYSYGRLNLLYVRNSAMLISERFGSVVDNGRCDRNRLCKFVIHIHTLTRVCCHVLRNVSIGEIVSCTGVGVAVSLPHTLSIHDFLVPMEHSFSNQSKVIQARGCHARDAQKERCHQRVRQLCTRCLRIPSPGARRHRKRHVAARSPWLPHQNGCGGKAGTCTDAVQRPPPEKG